MQRSLRQKMVPALIVNRGKFLKRIFLGVIVVLVINWIIFAKNFMIIDSVVLTKFRPGSGAIRRPRQRGDEENICDLNQRSFARRRLAKGEEKYVNCSTVNSGPTDGNDGWIYGDTFYLRGHGCSAWKVVRRQEDGRSTPRETVITHETFLAASCASWNGSRFENVLTNYDSVVVMADRPDTFKKPNGNPTQKNEPDRETVFADLHNERRKADVKKSRKNAQNVLIIVIDGLSRASWRRSLPLTTSYITQALDGKEFNNYNVSWHGEPAALLPILTGKMLEELPMPAKHSPETAALDYSWVWEEFRRSAYITAFAQDDLDTPQVDKNKMKIFESQPVDYSIRVFPEESRANAKRSFNTCLKVLVRRKLILDWFRDLFESSEEFKKFFVGSLSATDVRSLDWDLRQFFMDLKEQGHLDSSLIILTSDHYLRTLPYLVVSVSPWLRTTQYSLNLQENAAEAELVTPFDIHETLRDCLSFNNNGILGPKYPRGISLFRELPEKRSCAHAGVAPQWCTCLPWQVVVKSPQVNLREVAKYALEAINIELLLVASDKCFELELMNLVKSYRYTPSLEERQAAETLKKLMKGKVVVANSTAISAPFSMWAEAEGLFKFSFLTDPGEGQFEAIYAFNFSTGQQGSVINRVSSPFKNPECLPPHLSHLKPFCHCKH